MEDVARLAGVSLATVSHVMNGTRFVSPKTAEKVQRAIQQAHYTPNSLARALATNTTSSVGLVFSWIANPYFTDIIGAIESECHKAGISVLLSDSNDDPEKELRVVQELHQRRVDGIFIAPTPDTEGKTLAYLRANHICTVLIDREVSTQFDYVGIKNAAAVEMLVDHLVKLGHREISFLPGHANYKTTLERTEGFLRRMQMHGLSERARVADPSNNTDMAAQRAHSLITGDRRPQALVAGNNLATIGTMRALRDLGLKVPADIAIVGIDDFEWADMFEPRLTVIAQPCRDIGSQAAALMIHRIDAPSDPVQHVQLEPRLIVRESCGFKK